VVLAAADPANRTGPRCRGRPEDGRRGRVDARAERRGALGGVVDGGAAWFLERGGRSLLSFTDDAEAHIAAGVGADRLVSSGRVGSLLVEKVNGVSVLETGCRGCAGRVQMR